MNGLSISMVILILLLLIGFLAGIILTAVFFTIRSRKNQAKTPSNATPNQFQPAPTMPSGDGIKQCPECRSTYIDKDLNYCLRDGATLKMVGFLPPDEDAEETILRKGVN